MVEKILNNTTPYGKIRASHEGSLHSSTLKQLKYDNQNFIILQTSYILTGVFFMENILIGCLKFYHRVGDTPILVIPPSLSTEAQI